MRSLWRGTGKMGGARCPNHAVLKTVVWVTPAPRVRIPPPPLRAAIPPRQGGCGFRRRRAIADPPREGYNGNHAWSAEAPAGAGDIDAGVAGWDVVDVLRSRGVR